MKFSRSKRWTILLTVFVASTLFQGCNTTFFLNAQQCWEKGEAFRLKGNLRAAYSHFLAATKKEPGNPDYHWAAAQVTQNRNLALVHANLAWEKGMRTGEVLRILSVLIHYPDPAQRLSRLKELYYQIPDSARQPELLGDLYLDCGHPDSSLAVWEPLFDSRPSPALCTKIAAAHILKGESGKARALLQSCRSGYKLDERGHIMLARLFAAHFEYSEVDALLEEATRTSSVTPEMQLEHAGILVIQNRGQEALSLLGDMHTKGGLAAYHARMVHTYSHGAKGDTAAIHAIAQNLPAKGPMSKERDCHIAIAALVARDTSAVTKLESLAKELPPNPLLNLIIARGHAILSRHSEALTRYTKIPEPLRSYNILIETAVSMAATQQDDKALIILESLHRRSAVSRRSLELFRDITLRKNLLEQSSAAQRILESQHGDDFGLRLSGVNLAIRRGKLDSALTLCAELSRKFPDEKRLTSLRLSILLLKKEFRTVLAEAPKADLTREELVSMLARAYQGLSKPHSADSIYRSALDPKNMPLSLQYAQFLTEEQRYDEAAQLYHTILKTHREKIDSDSSVSAVLHNNLAWAMLSTGRREQVADALPIAQKAFLLKSNTAAIVDTYTKALFANNRIDECKKILERFEKTDSTKDLSDRLAKCYERTGEVPRVRKEPAK